MATQTKDSRKIVVVGCSLVAGFFLLVTALHLFLPAEYRACSLMPGFCKPQTSRALKDFERLDKGYGGGPKFGLTSSH